MHVLQVVASVGWAGLERCVVEVSNELAKEHQVTVLLPPSAVYRDRFVDAVRLEPIPAGSRRNPLTNARLGKAVRAIGPDIVHAHATKASEMVWWASRMPGGLGVPFVATKHNTRRSRIFDYIEHVTGVSKAVARSVPGGQRVHVVGNGVRRREVTPRPKPDVFTMASITRLDPYKRVDVLIRALAELDFPARLVIAGEGSEREALESLAGEVGVAEQVDFLGLIDDVPELLSSVHMQVTASTREGFSLGIIEGLQYADVVLTTPVGGAPEILTEDFLVGGNADDAIAASAKSRRDVEHAGVTAAAFAESITRIHADYDRYVTDFAELRARHGVRFTWEAVTGAYLEVYAQVLDS